MLLCVQSFPECLLMSRITKNAPGCEAPWTAWHQLIIWQRAMRYCQLSGGCDQIGCPWLFVDNHLYSQSPDHSLRIDSTTCCIIKTTFMKICIAAAVVHIGSVGTFYALHVHQFAVFVHACAIWQCMCMQCICILFRNTKNSMQGRCVSKACLPD